MGGGLTGPGPGVVGVVVVGRISLGAVGLTIVGEGGAVGAVGTVGAVRMGRVGLAVVFGGGVVVVVVGALRMLRGMVGAAMGGGLETAEVVSLRLALRASSAGMIMIGAKGMVPVGYVLFATVAAVSLALSLFVFLVLLVVLLLLVVGFGVEVAVLLGGRTASSGIVLVFAVELADGVAPGIAVVFGLPVSALVEGATLLLTVAAGGGDVTEPFAAAGAVATVTVELGTVTVELVEASLPFALVDWTLFSGFGSVVLGDESMLAVEVGSFWGTTGSILVAF